MIREAARQAAQSGKTSDPMISAIWMAELINQRNGGALLKPWELDDVPEDWLDAYTALVYESQQEQERQKQRASLERHHQSFRQRHPTYRK